VLGTQQDEDGGALRLAVVVVSEEATEKAVKDSSRPSPSPKRQFDRNLEGGDKRCQALVCREEMYACEGLLELNLCM
jgi:hypothetical protein